MNRTTPCLSAGAKSVAACMAVWRDAMRWRRVVEHELAQIRLTFTQWLVLDATETLISESGDAVSQMAVAAHIELDQMTVSRVMSTLSDRSLVSREPGFGSPAYRIWLTSNGEAAVAAGRSLVEAASLRYQFGEIQLATSPSNNSTD